MALKAKHRHDKDGVVCNHVQKGKRPLRVVAQDPDGVWQFMCGMEDHTNPRQAKKTCVACMFDGKTGDLTMDLVPKGHIARRGNSKAPWRIDPMTEDEINQIDEPEQGKD